MNYQGKKVAITGASGFLGRHLVKGLTAKGATVIPLTGDVRDIHTFTDRMDHSYDYLFHFGAPSSQVLFKRRPMYCAESTLLGFIHAANVSKRFGVRLIYPSTGLLSSDRTNEYARCKSVQEQIHLGENLDALGIRIFGTYGPGESHKADYASVPYLFVRDVLEGRQPVVFGDGNQKRDFIFVEDTVEGVLALAERCPEPIIDLGFGKSYSFNEVLAAVTQATGRDVEPIHQAKPGGYVEETVASTQELHRYYQPKITLREGIERTVISCKKQS